MGIVSFLQLGLVVVMMTACGSPTSTESKQEQEGSRKSYTLPPILDEISGHIFLPGNDSVVYAVQDEQGVLYGYNLPKQQLQDSIVFAGAGDFEGVTTDGSYFYVLKSNGAIASFPTGGMTKPIDVQHFEKLVPKGEYESLGIDTTQKKLFLLCKHCKDDKKSNTTTGYIIDYTPEGTLRYDTSFTIDLNKVSAVLGKNKKEFRPSAITKRASSNEWYILSSLDKMILITDPNFEPLRIIPLSRKAYEQPEGIAFDSQDRLYISSEKGNTSSAMLYQIQE